jgi:hypothetical protein
MLLVCETLVTGIHSSPLLPRILYIFVGSDRSGLWQPLYVRVWWGDALSVSLSTCDDDKSEIRGQVKETGESWEAPQVHVARPINGEDTETPSVLLHSFILVYVKMRSRDSSVTGGLRAGWPRKRISIPDSDMKCFFSPQSLGPSEPPVNWLLGSFPGVSGPTPHLALRLSIPSFRHTTSWRCIIKRWNNFTFCMIWGSHRSGYEVLCSEI